VPWPAAEVQITEELVRELLAEQHPDLAELPLRITDSGFDNELWRLGDDLVVRMPRRAVAADLLANEQRWLPGLAERLPLAVPLPLRLGRPSLGYPWPWSVLPWLTGDPGDQVPVTDRCDAGQRLGAFLRALHQPAPPSAPFNSWRSVPLTARVETFEAQLAALGTEVDSRGIRRVWRRAISAEPYLGPAQWIHGDLHPANTLTAGGTLVAVIDFGDLCAGDPATDVAALWMLLPNGGLGPFQSTYGTVEPALGRRALGWAALFGTMLLELGFHGRPTYERMARAALERVVASAAF
jgi:aminoglycoside phosphotransferase (APT) family kinase protein